MRLYNLFKNKKLPESDLFAFKQGVENLPVEIREQLKKIEEINPFEFKDGIDTESHDYVYLNAFNQFRYENENIINLNVYMMQKHVPLNEMQLWQQLKKCNVPLLGQ